MRAEVSRLASLLTEQAGTFKRETQCLRDESHALRLCRDEHEAQLRKLSSAARAHAGMRRAREELESAKLALQAQVGAMQQENAQLMAAVQQRRQCVRCGSLTEAAHDVGLRDRELQKIIH